MVRFLGAIQNANILLLLVSATVLLFAFSPNDYSTLERAYDEANAVRQIYTVPLSFVLGTTVDHLIWSQLSQVFKSSPWDAESTDFSLPIQTKEAPHGDLASFYDFYTNSDPDWLVVLPLPLSVQFRETWGSHPIITESPNVSELRFFERLAKELLKTIDSAQCHYVTKTGIRALKRSVLPCKQIPKYASVTSVRLRISDKRAKGEFVPNATSNVFGYYYYPIYASVDSDWTAVLDVYWHDDEGDSWHLAQPVRPIWAGISVSPMVYLTSLRARWQNFRYAERTGADVYDATTLLINEGPQHFLAALRDEDWATHSVQTPVQVMDYLETRLNSTSRNSISLFGLNVDQRVALVVGPLAIFVFSIYLLALLRISLGLLNKATLGSGSLEPYPWFGLFTDRLSVAVTISTAVIVPPFSAALMTYRNVSGLDSSTIVAVVATASVVIISVFTAFALRELRRRFADVSLSLSDRPT